MTEKFTYYSPIGPLLIEASENKICKISFSDREIETSNFDDGLRIEITGQFDQYFAGTRYQFDLPVHPEGTDFQKRVWEKLLSIPYGENITYSELALILGDKKLIRAVGGANSKNPLAIIVPCHRVIGQNKKLIGYAGGLWRKKWLLQHELTNSPVKNTLL